MIVGSVVNLVCVWIFDRTIDPEPPWAGQEREVVPVDQQRPFCRGFGRSMALRATGLRAAQKKSSEKMMIMTMNDEGK